MGERGIKVTDFEAGGVLSLSLGMLEEGEEGESGSDSVSEDEESVGVGGWRASLGARPSVELLAFVISGDGLTEGGKGKG